MPVESRFLADAVTTRVYVHDSIHTVAAASSECSSLALRQTRDTGQGQPLRVHIIAAVSMHQQYVAHK